MGVFEKLCEALEPIIGDAAKQRSHRITHDARQIMHRFGQSIPEALTSFYEWVNGKEQLCNSHSHILGTDEVYIQNQIMVIVEERERYYKWGVCLSHTDETNPRIAQGTADSDKWSDYGDMSCFLANTLCWQVLNTTNAMATTTVSNVSLDVLSGVFRSLSDFGIETADDDDTISFVGQGVVAVMFPRQHTVFLGGSDVCLESIHEQYHMPLNWL